MTWLSLLLNIVTTFLDEDNKILLKLCVKK